MNSGTIQASENFIVTNTNMKPTAEEIKEAKSKLSVKLEQIRDNYQKAVTNEK